jgi:hypothetical protein
MARGLVTNSSCSFWVCRFDSRALAQVLVDDAAGQPTQPDAIGSCAISLAWVMDDSDGCPSTALASPSVESPPEAWNKEQTSLMQL